MTVRQPDSALVEALLMIIEPFRALANQDPLRATSAETDTGHEEPAMRDKTFAFLISTFTQNAHNQLYGTLRATDGRQFDNAKTWLQTARNKERDAIKNIWDADKSDIENKLSVATNSDWIRANHYVRMNEEKCAALEELIIAGATVYKQLTNEDWKPRNQQEQPVRKIQKTSEEEARLLALLEQTMRYDARVA